MSLKVGFAKKEIRCFFPGLGMMGYGQAHNTVKEQATPLYARAIMFEDLKGEKFIFINCELAFITIALKEELTRRLQNLRPQWKLSRAGIMMTAQHTHSAPGGYSHYPFYNFTIPGFQVKVFEAILKACADAVVECESNLLPSQLKIGSYEVPADAEVAFNRSMRAYLNNPDAKKLRPDESHLAVDRTMRALNVYDTQGNLRAHLNWFGVHCTNISSFNNKIHHDNKGVASVMYEKAKPSTLAIFAQAAAGDISPNFIYDREIKRLRGKTKDQYENAALNGEIQFQSALMMQSFSEISGHITARSMYYDMRIEAADPAHGVAFFGGTLDGPGLPGFAVGMCKIVSRTVRTFKLMLNSSAHAKFYEAHGKKDVLLDHRSGEFIGLPLSLWKKLPQLNDPVAGNFIRQAKSGAIDTCPWVPPILPLQIVTIGPLVILGVPGEITVMAAKRLKESLKVQYPGKELIVSSYANAYMGYITTPEEYDMQCYEGGHTVYGRNTLHAIISGFNDLATNNLSSAEPFSFPQDELRKRSFT